MATKKLLDDLFAQEMSRREFLARMGSIALALVGVTGFLRTLSNFGRTKQAGGYGSSSYGGERQAGTTFTTSR